MDALAPFRIPIATLQSDEAAYSWELGPDFLAVFDDEHEPLEGLFSVQMDLSRSGTIITLEFQITGTVQTICDRCLAPIPLQVGADYELVVKFGDPAESTDEVLFVDPDAPGLNVAQHIYDFALLSIPISQRIPGCESLDPSPCDETVLAYLLKMEANEDSPGGSGPSPWDEIKKITDN